MATPEQMIRQIQSQQSLRQGRDRNTLLQRQQQLTQLQRQQEQIRQQERQQELRQAEIKRQQQEISQIQSKELQKQQALKTLVEKGKGSAALYSLSPQERAEIEAIAGELKASRARSAGIVAVSKAEQTLSASLAPELRRGIYQQAASGASLINLPDLDLKFRQFTQPQFTPLSQGATNIYPQTKDKYFYTPAPLSVTDPSKFRRQQISKILQTPEKSFRNIITELGKKSEQYSKETRGKGFQTLGATGVLPYTPKDLPSPEVVRGRVETTADIGSFFTPVVGQARLISLGSSATGKIVEGDPQGIKEAGLLASAGLFFKSGSGIRREISGESNVVSTKFISQRQSGKATDINAFAKELSELTDAPVAIRSQSRINSGVVQIKNAKGQTERFTYKLSEESLGGGITEFGGNRLTRGFIKDSEGNIVSRINAISSESAKDTVSKILTTSITDTSGLGLRPVRRVQTIAEQIVSTPTVAPKGTAFIVKKPKGISITQSPTRTSMFIGEKPLKVKYFEDIGVAVAKAPREVEAKALIRIKPQKFIRQLETKFDEGTFESILRRPRAERAIAKTSRVVVDEPINILEGSGGIIRRTRLEREFGSTRTEFIPSKPKIERKGVSMNTFLGQFYARINKIERQRRSLRKQELLSLKKQLGDLRATSSGTSSLIVKGALPTTLSTGRSRITSGALFGTTRLSGTPTYFEDTQILALPPSAPRLEFINLGLVQRPRVTGLTLQIPRQETKQLVDTRNLQQVFQTNIPRTDLIERILPIARSGQLQRQQQQQLQIQRQKQLQRQVSLTSPRPSITTSRRGILPFISKLGSKERVKEVPDSLGFLIEIRRRGKFKQVGGTETTLERALKKASRIVGERSLARSFRLRSSETGQLLDIRQLPRGFRRAKREARTFVEEARFALSSPSEKQEIKYFKNIKSGKRRRLL